MHLDLDDMCRILASGTDIVTPASFIYPAALDPAITERLADASAEGASTLYGAGIHPPGFSPVICCRSSSRVCRIASTGSSFRRSPIWRRTRRRRCVSTAWGFGRDPEEALADPSA